MCWHYSNHHHIVVVGIDGICWTTAFRRLSLVIRRSDAIIGHVNSINQLMMLVVAVGFFQVNVEEIWSMGFLRS